MCWTALDAFHIKLFLKVFRVSADFRRLVLTVSPYNAIWSTDLKHFGYYSGLCAVHRKNIQRTFFIVVAFALNSYRMARSGAFLFQISPSQVLSVCAKLAGTSTSTT